MKTCKHKSDIERYVIFGIDIDFDELTNLNENVHIDEDGVYISSTFYYGRINTGDYILLYDNNKIKRILSERDFNLLYEKVNNKEIIIKIENKIESNLKPLIVPGLNSPTGYSVTGEDYDKIYWE